MSYYSFNQTKNYISAITIA